MFASGASSIEMEFTNLSFLPRGEVKPLLAAPADPSREVNLNRIMHRASARIAPGVRPALLRAGSCAQLLRAVGHGTAHRCVLRSFHVKGIGNFCDAARNPRRNFGRWT